MTRRKWRENPVVEKLATWFFFSVVVALTPFAFGFFQAIDHNQQFTFSLVLGSGQLFLVSVAITAAALGDLVAIEIPAGQRIMKTLAIGSCTLVIIISSLWFGDISASIQGKITPDPRTISAGSFVIYVWALLSSAWCLSMAAHKGHYGRPEAEDQTSVIASLPDIQQDEEK